MDGPAAMSQPTPLAAGAAPTPPRTGLAILLSLILLLFLGHAAISVLDSSFLLFADRSDFNAVNGLLMLAMFVTGIAGYGLMALSPAIPKRFFLPVCLFIPVVYVGVLPLLVYFYQQALWITWIVAIAQLLLGLFILRRAQNGSGLRWPLIPAAQLNDRNFNFGNFFAVAFAGAFVLLPGLAFYAGFSAQLAVGHFTDGFVRLHPSGISMQVRKYAREDGGKITLVPMSHIGESDFYRDLAASFPEDSVILMEGVTDQQKLMKSGIDYSRAASAAGAVEQVTAFKPRGEIVPADVDVSTFSPATLEMLRVAMLLHTKGVTPETLPLLMKPTPPGLEKQLLDDLLTKRNRHLLDVIQQRLGKPGTIVVPWGAAHMPEIAREIQKSGFRMIESQDFVAIRFGS
jgi:hypothetical protein